MPRLTVRLGALTRSDGRWAQKGVDAAMHAELTELARNRACSDVVLITGDGNLLPGMMAAKEHGVAVHLWAVQAADGSEAYTRRGDLQVAPSGVLQTGDGFIVMGQGGPITLPPASSVTIGSDGSISIVPQGDATGTPQIVDRLKLASVAGSDVVKGLDNLLRVRGGGALPADLNATVQGGALEGSNVNMTQALVEMIENQRSYEVQANLLKEARTMDEGGASLMRLPS